MNLELLLLEIRLFFDSLITAIPQIIPRLFFALIILLAGFLIGKGFGKVTHSLMKKAGIDKALKTTEAEKITERVGFKILAGVELFIRWVIYIVAIFLAVEILRLPGIGDPIGTFIKYVPNILVAFFIIIVGFIVADKIAILLEKFFEDTNIPKYWFFGKGVRYFIYALVGITALTQLKISTGVFVITVTVIMVLWSVITVIGVKNIVPNFFSGIFIVFYGQIKVGDKIKVQDVEGVVEEISLISTKIRRDDGKYLLIPNSKILDNVIEKE